jgi:hypothetical protein
MVCLRDYVVVVTAEFAMLNIYRLATLGQEGEEEVMSIIAERTVVAASQRWLAYCGCDEVATAVAMAREETASESVTRNVMSGISTLRSGLWGRSPHLTSAQAPLGTVVIVDVESGRHIANFAAHNHGLQCMAFDGSGTMLATASQEGTTINVFQVMVGADAATGRVVGNVALLYRLQRGVTQCTVSAIAFAPLNGWVAVCSSIGTCHFYRVPDAQRRTNGVIDEGYTAPALSATCRMRSAPSQKPVDPQVVFSADMQLRPELLRAYVTSSASATTTQCELAEHGVRARYTQHLNAFAGPLSGAAQLSSGADGGGPADGGAHSVEEAAHVAWRSHIELRTHPVGVKLGGHVKVLPLPNELAAAADESRQAAARSPAAGRAPPLQQQQQHAEEGGGRAWPNDASPDSYDSGEPMRREHTRDAPPQRFASADTDGDSEAEEW